MGDLLRNAKGGSSATIDGAQVRAMKARGKGASEIAKALKIGRASVYRVLGWRHGLTTAPTIARPAKAPTAPSRAGFVQRPSNAIQTRYAARLYVSYDGCKFSSAAHAFARAALALRAARAALG
jgi:hypothetical protein